jgi:hypothetical protein
VRHDTTIPPTVGSILALRLPGSVDLVAQLVTDALVDCERDATTLVLHFRTAEGVEQRVRALAALEAECCPFLVIAVNASASEVALRIAGPPEAGSILEEFFPDAQSGAAH